jgi:hypothetical protein
LRDGEEESSGQGIEALRASHDGEADILMGEEALARHGGGAFQTCHIITEISEEPRMGSLHGGTGTRNYGKMVKLEREIAGKIRLFQESRGKKIRYDLHRNGSSIAERNSHNLSSLEGLIRFENFSLLSL